MMSHKDIENPSSDQIYLQNFAPFSSTSTCTMCTQEKRGSTRILLTTNRWMDSIFFRKLGYSQYPILCGGAFCAFPLFDQLKSCSHPLIWNSYCTILGWHTIHTIYFDNTSRSEKCINMNWNWTFTQYIQPSLAYVFFRVYNFQLQLKNSSTFWEKLALNVWK